MSTKLEQIGKFIAFLAYGNVILSIATIIFYFMVNNTLTLLLVILMLSTTGISLLLRNYYIKITKDDKQ